MAYTWKLGMRYLRSKKRKTVSVITFISVTGVALGVAALLAALAIASGFQEEFRNKILGVNAHVLVMKYGVDFDEYREVIAAAEAMPEVTGAGPFLIHEMILAHGDRHTSVLVKGTDPDRLGDVLDLPNQLIAGSLEGLRLEGAEPAERPESQEQNSDWDWLGDLQENGLLDENGSPRDVEGESQTEAAGSQGSESEVATENGSDFEALPEVEVANPSDIEDLLGDFDDGFPEDDAWEEELLAGEEEEHEGPLPGIVLGYVLARSVDAEVGDRVRLVSPLSGIDLSLVAPDAQTSRSQEFEVIGIFEAGFQEYDSHLAYTDLFEAQRFYGQGDAVTGVEMRVQNIDTSADVARRLERDLGGPFHTVDWAELNRNLFTALKIQKVVLGFVIATIICVAAFNVVATLIMIVLEKKREVAILKAMGATDGTILGVFMIQGFVIGIIGTAVGLLLGGGLIAYLSIWEFALDPKVYLIDHLPVVVDGTEFLTTAVVAMAICTLSTILPSAWAARMLPVKGLRYE